MSEGSESSLMVLVSGINDQLTEGKTNTHNISCSPHHQMSDFTHQLKDYLPDDFEDKIEDSDYGEETAAKNYVVPILQDLGLEHADYEEIIESGDRPDFVWRDTDGIDRIVGELKKPWDEDNSPSNARYKIEQGIEEAEVYNDQLKLKYILVSDGRYIYLSNEYANPPESIELDLLNLYENADHDDVEDTISQLKSWITGLYEGEWNEHPSERDISDKDMFGEFIEASRSALNEDILPSIERRFETYEQRWNEFRNRRDENREKRAELQEEYRGYIDWDGYGLRAVGIYMILEIAEKKRERITPSPSSRCLYDFGKSMRNR
jgi:hypothetical protein